MSEGSGEAMETIRHLIEWVALSIDVLAVAVIVGAIVTATIPRGIVRTHVGAGPLDAFSRYKQRMGRGLLLGLELLLAAVIVDTVALNSTARKPGGAGLARADSLVPELVAGSGNRGALAMACKGRGEQRREASHACPSAW